MFAQDRDRLLTNLAQHALSRQLHLRQVLPHLVLEEYTFELVKAETPNFLVLLTDTQPTNFLGCYAGADRGTPHLDGLAARGTVFMRAYCASPLCTPSRAAFHSGQTPTRAGAYTNSLSLGQSVRTMGQIFRDAGYRCGHIGKWHLDGHDYFGSGECPDGWEDAYWYDGRRYLLDLTPTQVETWRRLSPYTSQVFREAGITAEFTWANRVSNKALRFLDDQKSEQRPYLLVCSYDEPHHPFFCPPEYIEKYEEPSAGWPIGGSANDSLEGKPEFQKDWADGPKGSNFPEGVYHFPAMMGCNEYLDHEIGRVLNAAQDLSEKTGKPTWIIHASDHGDHMGSHGLSNKGGTAYEANARVPLIVVRPGCAPAIQESVVSLMDVLPTLLEAAGIEIPAALDGASFLAQVGTEEIDAERQAVVEYTRYELGHDGFGGLLPMRALVRGPWKLVLNGLDTDELYNLDRDPHELQNLIDDADASSLRDQLHDALINWMYEHEDPWRGSMWEKRAWRDVRRDYWKAPMRPVRLNGVQPLYRDYDTGLPTRGVGIQYED